MAHAEHWPGPVLSPLKEGVGRPPPRDEAKVAHAWQEAVDKQNRFDSAKAVVDELQKQHDEICSSILETGANGGKNYFARMLGVTLMDARKQLDTAEQELSEAIRKLRFYHAVERAGGEDEGPPEDSEPL